MSEITFRCCKYLDHDESHFTGCRLKALHNFGVYFERSDVWTDGGKNPRDVQFCSKRGRLNDKIACLEGAGGECDLYDEEERTIKVNN